MAAIPREGWPWAAFAWVPAASGLECGSELARDDVRQTVASKLAPTAGFGDPAQQSYRAAA